MKTSQSGLLELPVKREPHWWHLTLLLTDLVVLVEVAVLGGSLLDGNVVVSGLLVVILDTA